MSEYYHQFLSSMAGVGGNTTPGRQDIPIPTPQPPTTMSLGVPPIPNPYQSLGYFTGFPDPMMYETSSSKVSRGRRKSAPGIDHVKHRRTRSGCYTCRSRRVKCDEAHPICERCKKGKRDCIYPDPPAPRSASSTSHPGPSSGGSNQLTSPTSSHDEDEEESDVGRLDTILDEDEPESPFPRPPRSISAPRRASTTSALTLHRPGAARQSSETPSLEGNKSSSPTASTGTTSSFATGGGAHQLSDSSFAASGVRTDWSQLAPDLRSYLAHFCDNMTHHHYCIAQDTEDFFRVILPNIAVRNEHLLYAVVGFSAYNRTLQDPNGKIQEFLHYYNKSVNRLLQVLKRKDRHNVSVLLTILQLATIEEYLGDWVNLMGHQKAALEILRELYTPQTIMQSPTSRMILAWYSRFDTFVGLMGGFETGLPGEWFESAVDFWEKRVEATPDNAALKMERLSAELRLVSRDMTLLFARSGGGLLADGEFATQHAWLGDRLDAWRAGWDPAFVEPANFAAASSSNASSQGPLEPAPIFDFPLFPLTILESEWHALIIMHKSQAPPNDQQQPSSVARPPPPDVADHALAVAQLFEAVETWPKSPRGSLVTLYAGLAISALFLPRNAKHELWMRQKFAKLEAMGYVFPLTMRTRMAELFHDASCVRWWLPDDESFSPILQSVRTYADERNTTAANAQINSLREAKQIFAKMQLAIIGAGASPPGSAVLSPLATAATKPQESRSVSVPSTTTTQQDNSSTTASSTLRVDVKGKGTNIRD